MDESSERSAGETRCCRVCGEHKPVEDFYPRRDRSATARVTKCKDCAVTASRDWQRAHPETVRARNTRQNARLKLEVLTRYSDAGYPRCRCCHAGHIVFLALDHVNDDGNAHRSRVGQGQVYRDLKRRGFPNPDQYQVLCHNCNWAKRWGDCPHQDEESCSNSANFPPVRAPTGSSSAPT